MHSDQAQRLMRAAFAEAVTAPPLLPQAAPKVKGVRARQELSIGEAACYASKFWSQADKNVGTVVYTTSGDMRRLSGARCKG